MVFFGNCVDLLLRSCNDIFLLRRDRRITDSDGDGAAGGVFIALRLDIVENVRRAGSPVDLDAAIDDLAELLLAHQEIDLIFEGVFRIGAVDKAEILRDRIVEDNASDGGIHQTGNGSAVHLDAAAHLDLGVQADHLRVVGHEGLVRVAEDLAFARLAVLVERQVVGTEHHVLRRHGDGASVGGLEQVAGSQHQEAGLGLRLRRKRHVHSHLVAVEVRVVGGAGERVQLERAALYEHRLKCLNAQAVQRRRAVQKHRVVLNYDFERVPHLRLRAFDSLSGGLDVAHRAGLDEALHHERLEQLERHLLRQTALVHLQLRADNDNGTAGVVDALAEQVLTETALLALEHIGKGLERAVIRARHRTAAAAIVDQGIHSLLQHPLLVAHDDIRRAELQQTLEAVIAVDHAAVQIVEV